MTILIDKLVQLSFSKILESRKERGGAELRKNLLILLLIKRAGREIKLKFSTSLSDDSSDKKSVENKIQSQESITIVESSINESESDNSELSTIVNDNEQCSGLAISAVDNSRNDSGHSQKSHRITDNIIEGQEDKAEGDNGIVKQGMNLSPGNKRRRSQDCEDAVNFGHKRHCESIKHISILTPSSAPSVLRVVYL